MDRYREYFSSYRDHIAAAQGVREQRLGLQLGFVLWIALTLDSMILIETYERKKVKHRHLERNTYELSSKLQETGFLNILLLYLYNVSIYSSS